ncbi:MAG: HAD-IIA family hydrolase [Promethearchaeota archaeon]|nr:MAG: HAD-IIA family hydrolase [Candidatus Lokiarchaeota archaeon]
MTFLEQDFSELRQKKVFFFDLDGTLYLGEKLFDGVLDLIELLKDRGKKVFYLSNNSSRSTKDYILKLKKFNLPVSNEEIILSQHPTINYLHKNKITRIFLLGTSSLREEFIEEGFNLTDKNPEIVVLAFDKELTYDRLEKASKFLQKGIPYIATHLDNRCPVENGYIPDAGGIAALLYKTTERMPRVFGKPNKEMLLFKLEQLNLPPNIAVMVGDRLYTDIKMGKSAGITTCCVLSGETDLEMIHQSDEFTPDFIIEGIWSLSDIIF